MKMPLQVEVSAQAAPTRAAPPVRERGSSADRRFQLGMAIAFLLTALCGFGRSYYLRPLLHAAPLSPLLHVHAALFSAWLLLLLTQTAFIAAARVDLHRRLGIGGLLLAVAMVPAGFSSAIHSARAGVTAVGKNPMDLLVFQLGALLLFAGFVAAALVLRRRPDYHRRLILLATVSIIPPAIARLPFVDFRPPLAVALSLSFVVAGVIHDIRTRGRVHPAYVWGGLTLVASGPLRFLVGQTSAWQSFAQFLVS